PRRATGLPGGRSWQGVRRGGLGGEEGGGGMTEAGWDGCTEPQRMADFLRGKASPRKNRLLHGGCPPAVGHPPGGRRRGRAGGVGGGRRAEGPSRRRRMRATCLAAVAAAREAEAREPLGCAGRDEGGRLLRASGTGRPEAAAVAAQAAQAHDDGVGFGTRVVSPAFASDLIRWVFGSLFRPVAAAPAWLSWQGGTIPGSPQPPTTSARDPGAA